MPFDYLVIGGGGMLNDAEVSSSVFRVYFPCCLLANIPIGVISVGFGGETLAPQSEVAWGSLLQFASCITVRSLYDRDMTRRLVTPDRHDRIHLYADLAYGAPELYPSNTVFPILPASYVVYVPTGAVTLALQDIADKLTRLVWSSPGTRVVVLPMGGCDGTSFVSEEMKRVTRLFPDAIVFRGRGLGGEFVEQLHPSSMTTLNDEQSLALCVEVFRRARAVITGRFHGVVLARCFHVPVDTGTSNLTKILQEMSTPLSTSSWRGHVDALRADVLSCVCVPPSESAMIVRDPSVWDDDMRNTCIVDIATQTPPPSWTQTVPYIQGMTNQVLWQHKRALLTQRFAPRCDASGRWRRELVTVR
jgi:hypothetical protein